MVSLREGDTELFEQFFESDRIRPGFSGIGGFRGRRDYGDDERTVLGYFFTNTESNVYCATDNMPGELWALLMGQYARSNVTARDRLLQLFRDVKAKDKTGTVLSLEQFAEMIRQQGDIRGALEAHLAKAGRWIEEYGVDYGHASLRDSGVIRICMEGVSQRATKPLEKAREGAYQEISTRATPASVDSVGVPFEIRGTEYEERMLALDRELFALYDEVFETGKRFLAEKYAHLRDEADGKIRRELGDPEARLPDRAWDKAVTEKAFDLARSLLPQNMTTSLGITLNTRRFQDMLTEWQSSELAELGVLGRAAQIEAMKISPTLMKYGGPSEFVISEPERRRDLFEEFIGEPHNPSVPYGEMPLKSRLIAHTPDIEDLVLASILFHGSDGSISFEEAREHVRDLDAADRRKIAESYVEGMGRHDLFSKVAEVGTFTFERNYDIGAMRDLQRQRGDRQQLGPYAVTGYHMRREIEEMGWVINSEI
jgi:thymidylate synthase ThyX